MKPRLIAPFALVLAVAAGALAQQDLDGEAIVRRADRENRSRDERGVVEMVLESENGERQLRSMEIMAKTGEAEDDLNLVRFLAPPTVRGTAVLTVEATGRADDQWLYLPALRKTKRIASTQRTQRFAGTDFTYEDLRTEAFSQWTYRKVADARVGEFDCFVVEATPKDLEETGYSKRLIYVEKARFLLHKVEFFDKQGRHQKTLENAGWEQMDGLWRSRQAKMEDLLRHTKTVWRFTERAINPGLPDGTFTEANLERGL